MVVVTESKLLANYSSHSQLGRLNNSLLEKYSSVTPKKLVTSAVQTQRPLQSQTKNVLLEKFSLDLGRKSENTLLKEFEKFGLKGNEKNLVEGGMRMTPLPTESKVLMATDLRGKLSLRLEPRQQLSNPLLEGHKSLLSKNRTVIVNSGLSLRTKSSLLAPSFNLGRNRVLDDAPEKVRAHQENQQFAFSTEAKVDPLSPGDFVDVAPLGDDNIKFPMPHEIRQTFETSTTPLTASKTGLIECVCTSVINNPVWFSETDATRIKLFELCKEISRCDPEFVVKVALYARVELNIRATCNFLLAAASLIPPCRKFLRKYFEKAIILPSDWIQVAEFYQSLTEPSGEKNNPSLPAALRKVMVSKLPMFDEYQLAKYNKNKSKSDKKKGKKKEVKKSRSEEGIEENKEKDEEKSVTKLKVHIPRFTLKFLIRKLHVMKPAYPVMCILGKKYPSSVEDFYKCGLEGTWDSALAGKRMKLAVPETWETQVSAKGNLAKTWEELLDHRKLPFMAMLRNLRNMIKAGISDKHHTRVLKTLTNERAVTRSRQFPFRFFSAYEILSELEREIEKQENYKQYGLKYFLNRDLKALLEREFGKAKTEEEKKLDFIKKRIHKKYANPFSYDGDLLQKYRKALNESVRIATLNNVPPITGHTVILCDVTNEMMTKKCTTSKGIGSSRTLAEVGILLGLMCAYSCEASTFLICAGSKYRIIELEKGGILENLSRIISLAGIMNSENKREGFLPQKFLDEILLDRMKFNNLLVLSSALKEREEENLGMFLERYKDNVNSKMACFKVDLAGKKPSVANKPGVMNFSGYSDQILKFIALGSIDAQVNFVDSIDVRRDLVKVDEGQIIVDKNLPGMASIPIPAPWKTVRVFISSTIKDMGCERDALVQRVLPILRERAKALRLHVIETDLRWGITSEDSRYNRSVSICLREIRNCDIFVGILGERYGWIPNDYGFSEEGSEWLEDYPKGRSITELEIVQAAFQEVHKNKPCYFYLRDSTEIKREIPKSFRHQFFEQNSIKKYKLKDLKDRVSKSEHHVAEPYSANWDGIVDGAPKLTAFEEFEETVLKNLWDAITDFGKGCDDDLSKVPYQQLNGPSVQQQDIHNDFATQQPFVARAMLFSGTMRRLKLKLTTSGSLIALVGKPGSGKTALLAHLYQNLMCDKEYGIVCVHFAHSNIQNAQSPENILYRFCSAISEGFNLGESLNAKSDLESLIGVYLKLLGKLQNLSSASRAVYLLIDDLDSFGNMDWLEKLLQKHVTIVITCLDMGHAHKALKHIDGVSFHLVSDLSISDKREIVRSALGRHSKKLDESHFNNQLRVLLSKQQSSSPLYLTSVCDLIRTEETYESLGRTLKKLPHDLHSTLKWQLQRVEAKYCNRPGVVAAIFGLVHCSSKWKISGTDLYETLCLGFGDSSVNVEDVREMPFSRAFVCNVLNSVRSFLADTNSDYGKMLYISHALHQKVLDEVYFGDKKFLKSCHGTLADYYTLKLKENSSQAESDTYTVLVALSRLPTHLALSGRQNVLRMLVTDLYYLHYKCTLGLGSTLLEDFLLLNEEEERRFAKTARNATVSLKPWQEMHKFVKSCVHIISKYPCMLFQEALNQPKDSYPCVIASAQMPKHKVGNSRLICFEKGMESDTESSHVRTYDNLSLNDLTTCIATHSDSGDIAFGSLSGKVGILDKNSGKERNIWAGHVVEVTTLCFIDKSALLSASADGMISVWNVKEGYRVESFKAHERKVTGIANRPLKQGTSARVFVTASHDNSIAVWNVAKFKFITRIQTASPVNCIDFSPHDPRVAAGLWDASIRIWDVQTSKRVAVIRGHTHAVSSVQYSSCGNYIASCSQFEAIVRLWATGSGIPLGNFGEAYLTSPKAITFSQEGEYLVGTGEGTNENVAQIAVWNSRLGCEEMQYQVRDSEEYGNALCCKFNVSKTSLAVGFHEGFVTIFDSRLPSAVFTAKVHDSAVTCVTWTPGSATDSLFSGLFMPSVAVEFTITGSTDRTLKAVDVESESVVAVLEGHTAPVLCVDATSQWIASGGEDFSILLWQIDDLGTPAIQQQAMFGKLAQSNIAQSNLGHQEPKVVTPSRALHAHDAPVSCVAFNSAGTMLVSGGRDGNLCYWMIEDLGAQQSFQMQQQRSNATPKEILPLVTIDQAHMDWITCCSWNDSSDHIVTGSNDATLKVWNIPVLTLAGGKKEHEIPVHVLKGHSSGIASVAYKMGCIASAGGEDSAIKIWSHKGVEITNLQAGTRTNCCDIALRLEDSEEDTLNMEDEEAGMDWANEVETEEWKEEHQKRKPGSKMKRKTLSSEMQNINVVCTGNDANITLWKPLAGKKVCVIDEQAQSITQVQVCGKERIISRSSNGRLKLWDIKPSCESARQNGEVTGIAVLEDIFVTTCSAGFVYLWERDDQHGVKMANKAKVHTKGITAVCALRKNEFATASHDGNVMIWEVDIVQNKKKQSVRQIDVREKDKTHFDCPVVSLSVEEIQHEIKLWVGLVDGSCSTISLDHSAVEKNIKMVPDHHLVVGQMWGENSDGHKVISDKGFITGINNLSLENSEFVHCYNYVDGILSTKDLLVGTSNGFVYHTSQGTKTKMHQGRVTAILDSELFLLTASHDCTIKIWSKPTLKQIGQYYTSSPVTCARFVSKSCVLYGDSSGMINTLKLYDIA